MTDKLISDLSSIGAAIADNTAFEAQRNGQTTTEQALGSDLKTYIQSWLTKAMVGLGSVANSLQLVAANNLSDVASVATARANLLAAARRHVGYVSGRWYFVPDILPSTGATSSQNTITLFPFIPPSDITISDLAIRIATTQSGKKIGLAVYAGNTSTVRPTGNPLGASSANLDFGSATANVAAGGLTANPALTAGNLYWLAFNTDATTGACAGVWTSTCWIAGLIGTATAMGASNELWNAGQAGTIQGVQVASQTFSGTPYTFPDLTSATFTLVANGAMPNIAYKAA